MAKLFIEDLQLRGKRVLMRVDFNVPVKDGRIENDRRLRASLPSIRYVLARGASLVLMSHLGRPGGRRIGKYSLGPVAERLQDLLGAPVRFLPDCVGPDVERGVRRPQARGGGRAREPALPHRGGGQDQEGGRRLHHGRSRRGRRLPRLADEARRCLCQRCLRGRAPRAQLGDRGQPAAASGRLPDEEGAGLSRRGPREAEATVRRDHRWRQGLRQDRRDRVPAAEGRRAARRRGHGFHLLPGAGQGDRRLAGGERPPGDGPRRCWPRPTASWCCRSTPW